jgi:NAD(P)-dependent dehydrogenase (short-subunit alcohol dehydrogenase family)
MGTAIITGGSRGFGRALAGALVDSGWTVIVDGRDEAALAAVGKELGASLRVIVGDVTDPRHRAALVDAARVIGGLDLVVNNASSLGPTPLPRLSEVSVDALRALHEVNVLAPLALTQMVLPLLRVTGGAVLNVTSDAAVEAYEGWGAYGASKAALEQLSNVLSVEEPGVRIWWLDPGDMRTAMHQDAFPGEDISDRPLPETIAPVVLAMLERRPPSGRIRAADVELGGAT